MTTLNTATIDMQSDRDSYVYRLRKSGRTYGAIGAELGISSGRARELYERYERKEVKRLEAQRKVDRMKHQCAQTLLCEIAELSAQVEKLNSVIADKRHELHRYLNEDGV